MEDNTRDKMKGFILGHKVFCGFILLQLFIFLFLLIGLFGECVEMRFDAETLSIADEKVVVSEDHSIYITGKNDAEPFGRWIAGTEQFDLKAGMYEIAVSYQSLLYDAAEAADYENETGRIEILREETADNLYFNNLAFTDGDTYRTTRMWIRDLSGEQGLCLKINFFGKGELKIDHIVVRELIIWRFMRICAWLFGFIVIDVVIFYFFIYESTKNKLTNAVLIFTIFFVSLPMFTDMLFHGHDMNFHLTRILALAQSLSAGNIIEPIQTQMCNGYGYATPLFYGQLFLYLPAILYNLAVPMQICYQIYAIAVNAATCLIAYFSFKGLAKDHKIAVTGAVAYTLSIYRLTNQLVRAAVGEYTAMAFFPLIAYGFTRIYMKKEDEIKMMDYLPIVIGLSGVIQSHVLSCELAALFILLICIVNFKKTCSRKRFAALVKAAALTLLVNLGFLLPFLDSMRMDTQVKSNPINDLQVHGIYLIQVFAPFQLSFGGSIKGMQDEMSFALGLTLIIGITIFLSCQVMRREWRIKKNGLYNVGVECIIFMVMSIILSLKFFPWDSIKGFSEPLARVLCMIQFPWRYLATGTIFAVMATVIGLVIIKKVKGQKTAYTLCMALCITAVLTSGFYMTIFTNGIKVVGVLGDSDVNIDFGHDEYLLKDTSKEGFHHRDVSFDKNVITVADYQYENGITTFRCKNTADVEKPIEIPLLNYDNYHAYDIGTGKEIGIMNGTNNRVSLAVPAHFDSEVKVVYEIPLVWKTAYVISILSAVLIAAMVVRNRGKERLS